MKDRASYTYQEHQAVFLRETEDGRPSSLPLDWYVALAFAQVRNNSTLHAPDRNSHNSEVPPVFELVRYLKAHPELCARGPEDALQKVARSMSEMNLHWSSLGETNPEEAEIAFLDFWQRVRYPIGWTPLAEAARQTSIQATKLFKPRNQLFVRFVSLIVHLQKIVGADKNIFLPCREVAKVLGCSHETVWRMREFARKEGLIRQLTKGKYSGIPGAGEASEFTVCLERFDSALRQVR